MIIEQLKQTLLTQLAELSVLNQLTEPIYVDSNPANITTTQVHKKGNTIISEKTTQIEKLEKHRIILKTSGSKSIIICDQLQKQTVYRNEDASTSISRNINSKFYELFNRDSVYKKHIVHFNQSFIQKLIRKPKDETLVKELTTIGKDYNWMIVNQRIFNILSKCKEFKHSTVEDTCLIENRGNFFTGDVNITIYEDKEMSSDKVYFGKNDSISLIINKNVLIERGKSLTNIYHNSASITVEYLFKLKNKTAVIDIT